LRASSPSVAHRRQRRLTYVSIGPGPQQPRRWPAALKRAATLSWRHYGHVVGLVDERSRPIAAHVRWSNTGRRTAGQALALRTAPIL